MRGEMNTAGAQVPPRLDSNELDEDFGAAHDAARYFSDLVDLAGSNQNLGLAEADLPRQSTGEVRGAVNDSDAQGLLALDFNELDEAFGAAQYLSDLVDLAGSNQNLGLAEADLPRQSTGEMNGASGRQSWHRLVFLKTGETAPETASRGDTVNGDKIVTYAKYWAMTPVFATSGKRAPDGVKAGTTIEDQEIITRAQYSGRAPVFADTGKLAPQGAKAGETFEDRKIITRSQYHDVKPVFADTGKPVPPDVNVEAGKAPDGRSVVTRAMYHRSQFVFADTGEPALTGVKAGETCQGRKITTRARYYNRRPVFADTGDPAPPEARAGEKWQGQKIITRDRYYSRRPVFATSGKLAPPEARAGEKWQDQEIITRTQYHSRTPVFADTGVPAPAGVKAGETYHGEEIITRSQYSRRMPVFADTGAPAPPGAKAGETCEGRKIITRSQYYAGNLVSAPPGSGLTGKISASKSKCRVLVYADTGGAVPPGVSIKIGEKHDGRLVVAWGEYKRKRPVYADTGEPAPAGAEAGEMHDGHQVITQRQFYEKRPVNRITGDLRPAGTMIDGVNTVTYSFYYRFFRPVLATTGKRPKNRDLVVGQVEDDVRIITIQDYNSRQRSHTESASSRCSKQTRAKKPRGVAAAARLVFADTGEPAPPGAEAGKMLDGRSVITKRQFNDRRLVNKYTGDLRPAGTMIDGVHTVTYLSYCRYYRPALLTTGKRPKNRDLVVGQVEDGVRIITIQEYNAQQKNQAESAPNRRSKQPRAKKPRGEAAAARLVFADNGEPAPPGAEAGKMPDGRSVVARAEYLRNQLVYADTGKPVPLDVNIEAGKTPDGRSVVKRAAYLRNRLVYADTGKPVPLDVNIEAGKTPDGRSVVKRAACQRNRLVYADTGEFAPAGAEAGETPDGRQVITQRQYYDRRPVNKLTGEPSPVGTEIDDETTVKYSSYCRYYRPVLATTGKRPKNRGSVVGDFEGGVPIITIEEYNAQQKSQGESAPGRRSKQSRANKRSGEAPAARSRASTVSGGETSNAPQRPRTERDLFPRVPSVRRGGSATPCRASASAPPSLPPLDFTGGTVSARQVTQVAPADLSANSQTLWSCGPSHEETACLSEQSSLPPLLNID